MESFKIFVFLIIKLILVVTVGYGVWYLIIWFLMNESNPLQWNLLSKIIFLIMGGLATNNVINHIENKNQ
jgi:hypothetical protein